MIVVLSENFLLWSTNISYKLFPNKSINITLYFPYVVIAWTFICKKKKNFRNSCNVSWWCEVLVNFSLKVQLWKFCWCLLKFGSIFFLFIGSIFSKINLTECSSTKFFNKFEIFTHDQILNRKILLTLRWHCDSYGIFL